MSALSTRCTRFTEGSSLSPEARSWHRFAPTSASRAEVVKAAVEATKLEQALRTKRALEAAAERREEALSRRIDKARDELLPEAIGGEGNGGEAAVRLVRPAFSYKARRAACSV